MANQLNMSRRGFLGTLGATGAAAAALGLFGCGNGNQQSSSETSQSADGSSSTSTDTSKGIAIDSAAWSYDSDNDVYYQIGLQYCENPQAPSYESMGIYVPGAYFDAKDNGNGTFTCTPSSTGTVAGYTAATAPIVMPINTAGYSAQSAPTSYSANRLSNYLEAGFVYVYAGCRGRKMDDGACGAAPWGVTDLKAAVRTLRYNADALAGDTDRIFSFGHSGGGAQSAVLGVSGDAAGYDDYLSAIGAPTVDAGGNKLSDAIYGAMCWCPITCLIGADMAYEWNMGQFASSSTRAEGAFTRQLSQDLAAEYKAYINALGLVDENGAALALEDGGEGIATAGSYYDLVMNEIRRRSTTSSPTPNSLTRRRTTSTPTWVQEAEEWEADHLAARTNIQAARRAAPAAGLQPAWEAHPRENLLRACQAVLLAALRMQASQLRTKLPPITSQPSTATRLGSNTMRRATRRPFWVLPAS